MNRKVKSLNLLNTQRFYRNSVQCQNCNKCWKCSGVALTQIHNRFATRLLSCR